MVNESSEMPIYRDFRTPGQFIQYLLDSRGWTQRVLAIVLKADETGINKIISGKRPLDAEMAIDLSRIFEVPAEQFLELQKDYDLAQARLFFIEDPNLTRRAELFGSLPVSDMISRGWLDVDNMKDFGKVEAEVKRFFGAASIPEIKILPHAAKKTNAADEITPVQLAWLYRVRQIAKEMLSAKFSQQSAKAAVEKLKELRISAVAIRKVSRILTEAGIKYVIVEALPGSNIDGVCTWLDEKNPVIGMSLRHDRIDNFWFVLRHELEHVIQLHGQNQAMIDADLEGENAGVGDTVAEEEKVANRVAAEFCVPQKSLESFMSRKGPFFYERDILGFAATMQVHPGLVAGQLRHKLHEQGVKDAYRRFSNHLVKIRSAVSPGATVDGWGDIVPVG